MNYLFLVLLAVVPGILWMTFIYRQDRYEPEPKREIVKAFIVGIFCAFPAVLLERFIGVFTELGMTVIWAPVIEESVKFIFFLLFFYLNREFDEALDGIIYACSLALGFATIENIFYVLSAVDSGTVFRVAFARAVLSIPGHFLFSAMWGYAAGVVKFRLHRRVTLLAGLGTAILLHAGFNFSAMLSALGSSLFIILFSLFIWKIFSKRIRELQEQSRREHDSDI